MDLNPGDKIGRYTVIRKIAEGGMAEIYLAHERGPELLREVAVKRIREMNAENPEFLRMFAAEARLVASLHHANIVPVFDFDRDGATYYLAMEFVYGKTLMEVAKRGIERGKPLPPLLSLLIVYEVAKALAYAHSLESSAAPKGIVHRDVSPQNVLVSHTGQVKLTDFGIAKIQDGLTAAGFVKGKLAYMSPEQARGERVDAATDVFALGVVFWQLLAHRSLFGSGKDLEILKAVQGKPIVPPENWNRDVPKDVSQVVMTALARNKSQRYADGAALAAALRTLIFRHNDATATLDIADTMKALYGDPEDRTREVTVNGPGRSETPRPASVGVRQAVPPPIPPSEASLNAKLADGALSHCPTAVKEPTPRHPPGARPPPPPRAAWVEAQNTKAANRLARRLATITAKLRAPLASIPWRVPTAREVVLCGVSLVAGGAITLGTAWATLWDAANKHGAAPRDEAVATRSAETVPRSNPDPVVVAPPTICERPEPARVVPLPVLATVVAEPAASPSSAPATPRRAPPRKARIAVVTSVPANIYFDGHYLGESPGAFRVPAGSHRVRVVAVDSGVDRTVHVELAEGQEQRIEVDDPLVGP